MAEPKLLIPDDEYEQIKIRAAKQRVTPQHFMREAVRAALSGNVASPAKPPPPAAHKLREAAATARALADQLAALAGGEPAEPTISMSREALLQMLREIMHGSDTPLEARIDRGANLAREVKAAIAPPAKTDRGPTGTDGGQ